MIDSNNTANDTANFDIYVIAGGAGGGSMVVLLCIAASVIYCGRSDKKKKRRNPLSAEKKEDIDLDAPIVPPDPGKTDYVNEQAVDIIHKKAKFNLRKVIGEALAEQIKGLILDSERLTTAETLGTGNFGIVTKGYLTDKDGGNSQTVAVKSITGDDISAKDMKNFIHEILRMRHFTHPNVLNMIGLVIERNMPMVVMPYMSNGDLRTYISDPRNVLVARDLLDYARQVADGMDYLHTQCFIHRDLAARNCMVDHTTTVKVADFGLSRDIFNADYYKADDKAALPVRWMAIESLRDKKFTSKSDVWSFGVLLWEMFTRGATPYPTLDNNTVYEYVKKGERLINPSAMSDNVGELMRSCWAKDPMKRPSCKDISDQLTLILTEPEKPPSYDNVF